MTRSLCLLVLLSLAVSGCGDGGDGAREVPVSKGEPSGTTAGAGSGSTGATMPPRSIPTH